MPDANRKTVPELHPWRHLLLYCKNHYRTDGPGGDKLLPLRRLLAHETGLDLDRLSIANAYAIVARLFLELAEPWMVRTFMDDLFKWAGTATVEQAIEKMTGLLACVPVVRPDGSIALNLGEADPAILPLRDPDRRDVGKTKTGDMQRPEPKERGAENATARQP